MFLVLFLFCAGLVLAKECGVRGPSKHPSLYIVGGYDTERWEYPWMAISGGCAGSLINEQWVITAGHCADEQRFNKEKEEGTEFNIVLGAYNATAYDFRKQPYIVNESGSFVVYAEKVIR